MKRLEVSGAVRPIYESLGVKRLTSRSRTFCVLTICVLKICLRTNYLFAEY